MNLTATGLAAHGNGDEPAKLLIVDDVPQNLVAMEALLQRDGLQVLCAASGAQALELLWRWRCWMCTCRKWKVFRWPN